MTTLHPGRGFVDKCLMQLVQGAEPAANVAASYGIAPEISRLIGIRNRKLQYEALFEAGLGAIFSILTFGAAYFCLRMFLGMFFSISAGVATIGTLVYLVVATWAAWRRIRPLASGAIRTDREWLIRELSIETAYRRYGGNRAFLGAISMRNVLGALAAALTAGPAHVFLAIKTWRSQMTDEPRRAHNAGAMLTLIRDGLPLERIFDHEAAIVLRRLALIALKDRSFVRTTPRGREILSYFADHEAAYDEPREDEPREDATGEIELDELD